MRNVDLPDVSVLSSSYAKIEAVAEECFPKLSGYSRFVARNPAQENSFDALVLLPRALWPEALKRELEELMPSTGAPETLRLLRLSDLLRLFPGAPVPSKTNYGALCCALGELGLGIEPDVRFGGAVPELADPVTLFRAKPAASPTAGFGAAALLLQLASAVAAADGDFSEPEARKLREHIEGNVTVGPAEKQRLLARMATFRVRAPSLAGLKKTIDAMDVTTRSGVVDFLVAMVHADGVVAPEEIKVMEKIYALFGLAASALYTRLHELAVAPEEFETKSKRGSSAMRLDRAKVEHLKAVSAEVAKKLTVIFDSNETTEPQPETEPVAEASVAPGNGPLGLDVAHADLLTMLLERPEWTRAEFEELCSDKGLMPDGAIENINEAAFAKFDRAVIEGDDPLEIAFQVLQENAV